MFGSTTLPKESDKAAEILQTFLDKKTLPPSALHSAKGLAIFHALRGGMYLAGTSGTGIVVARLPDGRWSAPSAFSLRVASVGIVYGVDLYDCVCVLNTAAAVEMYRGSGEVKIGAAAGVVAGPVGVEMGRKSGGGGGEEGRREVDAVWTYTRSKGVFGGVTVDGMAIKELKEVNERFFGEGVTVGRILDGEVGGREGQEGLKRWNEVLRLAS